jgi:Flp pilus assembly protein TadD
MTGHQDAEPELGAAGEVAAGHVARARGLLGRVVSEPGGPKLTRWRIAAVLAMVLVATAAAYWPALRGDFVFDDQTSVVEQVALKDLPSYLRSTFWPALMEGGIKRPVTDLTFAVDYALSGFDTFSYHLGSLAIHLLAVLLVYSFTREILSRAGWRTPSQVALVVAGVFALHPLQSQAVAYIAQRSESLASLFYLAALLLLLRSEGRPGSPSGLALYLAATGAFMAGLGTKLVIITLPAAYLGIHLWFPSQPPGLERRREWLRAGVRVLPWLAVAAAFVVLTLRGIEDRRDIGFAIPTLPPGTYLVTQFGVLLRYLGLILYPARQSVDHDVAIADLGDPATLAAAAALLALVGGGLYLWRRAERGHLTGDAAAVARVTSFGVLWFFLLLAPSSSIVPVIDVMMEHRVYLASWGILVGVAVCASLAIGRLLPSRGAAAFAVAATASIWISLGAALHARASVWGSALALWSDVVEKSPAKARGWVNLGVAQLARGDVASAEATQQRALRLAPDDPVLLNSIAIRLLDQDRLPEAEQRAREAIAAGRGEGAGYNTLGEIELKRGNVAAAVDLFREAVRLDGAGTPSRVFNLALALERAGQAEEACQTWKQYLQIEGNPADRSEVLHHLASRPRDCLNQ